MVITSHEMSAQHNTSGTFYGLLSLDDKFVNTSPKNGISTDTVRCPCILETHLKSTINETA